MSQDLIIKNSDLIKAELDVQITTAKAYPRSIQKALGEAMEMATLDEETAGECFYALKRKSKDDAGNWFETQIIGPSIRTAEIVASCWGNIHVATRILGNNGKFVTVEGVAWDLEKNIKMSAEVSRSIADKNGKTFSTDMQVVTTNAASAIVRRNAIFMVIPKTIINKVYNEARKFAIGDQTKLEIKIKKLFERFNKMGIPSSKILTYLDAKSMSELDLNDVEILIGRGTAIKDGMATIDNAFDIETLKDKHSKANSLNEDLNNVSPEAKDFFKGTEDEQT